ncbi:hypothetical protein D1818_17635 [Aquimarina sp. BL5]|uniref:hypothetical protein n=1 Tax=Aquimarina sp. BL5 TaxID=1714860 RepID=UPI000E4808DA|nr:hypothetical protein [Aquimarina sp. BL5]AXT52564.1 hypothetical protein D1818_17635 [Aquimarina sp. BL5]RKN11250.1 hypothetical protein D7036_01160 [Aquimarina sp. BL5]
MKLTKTLLLALGMLLMYQAKMHSQSHGAASGKDHDTWVVNQDRSNHYGRVKLYTGSSAFTLSNHKTDFRLDYIANTSSWNRFGKPVFMVNPEGNAEIFGDINIRKNARIRGNARIDGTTDMFGDVDIKKNAQIRGNATINGNMLIKSTYIGDVGHGNSWAGFSHNDRKNQTDYGFLSHASGSMTLINKADTGNGYIGFRVGNIDKMVLTNAGNLELKGGDIELKGGDLKIGTLQLKSITEEGASTLLNISGGVKTDKVVLNIGSFPDYVFQKGYNLMPIETVANYVAKNKHLPNIPSEKEMVASGMDMRMISLKLVEKVEELTLYTIQQEEKLKAQNDIIQALSKRLEQLENNVSKQ